MIKQFSLSKKERLSHRNQIDGLFHHGIAFNSGVIRVIYLMNDIQKLPEIKILVTVPKRKFKKAVFRNRIKRLMKEAFRLHKNILYNAKDTLSFSLQIGFIYIGDKADISFCEIETDMTSALNRIAGKMIS